MSNRRKQPQYSQNFKDAVLQEVLSGEQSVSEISKLYGVSFVSVYKWMQKNSIPTPQREVIYVDLKDKRSNQERIKKLESKIRSLESALSDKVLENCALQAMVNVAERKYNLDLKKKSGTKVSPNSETKCKEKK